MAVIGLCYRDNKRSDQGMDGCMSRDQGRWVHALGPQHVAASPRGSRLSTLTARTLSVLLSLAKCTWSRCVPYCVCCFQLRSQYFGGTALISPSFFFFFKRERTIFVVVVNNEGNGISTIFFHIPPSSKNNLTPERERERERERDCVCECVCVCVCVK